MIKEFRRIKATNITRSDRNINLNTKIIEIINIFTVFSYTMYIYTYVCIIMIMIMIMIYCYYFYDYDMIFFTIPGIELQKKSGSSSLDNRSESPIWPLDGFFKFAYLESILRIKIYK